MREQAKTGQKQRANPGALLLHTFGRLPSSVKVTAGGVGRCREKAGKRRKRFESMCCYRRKRKSTQLYTHVQSANGAVNKLMMAIPGRGGSSVVCALARVSVCVCVGMCKYVFACFFLLVDVDGIVATGTHRFPFAAAAVRLYIVMPYRFIIQGICGVPGESSGGVEWW